MAKRVLVIQELGEYEVPMFRGETPENALQRYLDAESQDAFLARVREREWWITDENGKEVAYDPARNHDRVGA